MNRRDLDQRVDEHLTLNAFFHGSPDPLPVGKTLKAKVNKDRARSPIERLVDSVRPAGAPPRRRTWYMTEDPCAVAEAGAQDDQYTYRFKPTTPAVPVNYDWFDKVQDDFFKVFTRTKRFPSSTSAWAKRSKSLAERYWANTPSEHPQVEWLAPEVTVVERVRCAKRIKRKRRK